jgi:outer membrane protein assembly factor BamA
VIDEKQLEKVQYFSSMDSMITNNARYTCEVKSRIIMAKAAFNKNKALFTSKLDSNLRTKPLACYIRNIPLCGAETRALRKVDQKYLKRLKSGAGEGWRTLVGPIV